MQNQIFFLENHSSVQAFNTHVHAGQPKTNKTFWLSEANCRVKLRLLSLQ